MPHSDLKILPGVTVSETETLNQAGISASQLIRFIPDRRLGALVQKMGGWTKYITSSLGSIARCLWAWEDTNSNSYLVAGCEGVPAGGGGALQIVQNGNLTDITPQTTTANVAVDFSTTSGSNEVTIVHASSNIDDYDVVDIQTQVSVGGLILFGSYRCYSVSSNSYKIYAYDRLTGLPDLATSTVANGGSVPEFDTTSGSNFVNVTLANHNYTVGSTFPVLVATTVGGVTLYGNYIVIEIVSANEFIISGSTTATSTTNAFENSGDVKFVYYNGIGPLEAGSGYGAYGYGDGGYGTGIPPISGTGTPINAIDWTLDNWGEILISSPYGGPIYTWSPSSGDPVAQIIPEAPTVNAGIIVSMPQRQIVAWGSTFNGIQDPLLIRWCEVNNYNVWYAQIGNQAGSYRLSSGSRIVQILQGPQQNLIWTDVGIWSMQYTGSEFVYGFNEIAKGCGLIGRKAAGTLNNQVYWMSQNQFCRLSSNGVEFIPCPVWDVIFQDIDTDQLDNIRFGANSLFGEIMWFVPVTNGTITCVKYNITLDAWDYSTLNRTAWINQSVVGYPIGASTDKYLYQHETSFDADGQAMNSYFQTGYFVLTDATFKMFVDEVWPDMKWGYYEGVQNANILMTFYVTDYPNKSPSIYGPYTLTEAKTFITPRFRGRLVSIKIESNDIGSWWRLGLIRYRYQEDGRYY